jgi:uncharacterized protein involved in exopolysaccharide biosynthesis
VNSTLQESDITIDGALLADIARRRARSWVLIGAILFAAVFAYQLYLVPQTFTSTVSLTIQQPSSGGAGALALLTGQAANTKYMGILKSRTIAEQVEQKVHLAQLYHISFDKAVQLLLSSLRIKDESAEGLVYLDVSLPGPPKLAHAPADLRARIATATANVANAYVVALRWYYVTTDNDRDTVLLRGADSELHEARSHLDRSTEAMRAFLRSHYGVDPRILPTGGSGEQGSGGGSSATLGELPTLYTALGETETEIQMRAAAQEAQSHLVEGQLQNLPNLPAEDPLLQRARVAVTDQINLVRTLEITYGKDNPHVRAQQERLAILQQDLRRQEAGVASQRTTENVRLETILTGLRTKRDEIRRRIEEAKGRLRQRTELGGDFASLEREVEIDFRVLGTAMEESAKLRMSAVSAQSRVVVVDEGRPPKFSQPGPLRMTATGLVAVLLVLGSWLVVEYLRRSRYTPLGPPPGGSDRSDGLGSSGSAALSAGKLTLTDRS